MSYKTWSAVDDISVVTLVIAAVAVVRFVVVGSWNPDVVLMREVAAAKVRMLMDFMVNYLNLCLG